MSKYDWRDLARAANPATQHRPMELSEVQREILRLYREGLQVRDLATVFGMNDGYVWALIHGNDEPGVVA